MKTIQIRTSNDDLIKRFKLFAVSEGLTYEQALEVLLELSLDSVLLEKIKKKVLGPSA